MAVTVAPLLDVYNLYETSYTRLVRVRDAAADLGALPRTRLTLKSDRLATVRLALVTADEDGAEQPADLTGLVPWLKLHRKMNFYHVRDAVPTTSLELVVESPAAAGLCYVEMTPATVPDVGEYAAEVVMKDATTGQYATFAAFSLSVERCDI